MSDSLRRHGLQHTRPPCPSPTPRAYSKLMSIELVMPSNHLIFCHPLLFPPSILPSIRDFCSESVLHIRWPEHWSFSFSISSSNEYLGLISFRIDWLYLFAVSNCSCTNWKPQDWLLIRQNFSFARELTEKHPLGAFSSLGLKNAKAHFLVICLHTKWKWKSLNPVQLCDPMDESMEFSRPEYWNR